MDSQERQTIENIKSETYKYLSSYIGEHNSHDVMFKLRKLVEEQLHSAAKKLSVPYDLDITVDDEHHRLNVTMTFPKEYVVCKKECQCNHNECCDIWTGLRDYVLKYNSLPKDKKAGE